MDSYLSSEKWVATDTITIDKSDPASSGINHGAKIGTGM